MLDSSLDACEALLGLDIRGPCAVKGDMPERYQAATLRSNSSGALQGFRSAEKLFDRYELLDEEVLADWCSGFVIRCATGPGTPRFPSSFATPLNLVLAFGCNPDDLDTSLVVPVTPHHG